MSIVFSEDQEELRRTVRAFLDQKSPESEVRRLLETTEGYDPAVWQQMGEQLGLQGLAIPEEYGGSGYSYVELIVVLEEMGKSLLCAPYFSTVVLAANKVDDVRGEADAASLSSMNSAVEPRLDRHSAVLAASPLRRCWARASCACASEASAASSTSHRSTGRRASWA